MANEFARNLKDAGFVTTFALPASASSSTSQATAFDIGADVYKTERVEVELSVPALTNTMVGNGFTVTYLIESSTVSNFASVDQTLYTGTFTGAGSGIAAQVKRIRLPSNCARYVRGKVTLGASTTDSSSVSATVSVTF